MTGAMEFQEFTIRLTGLLTGPLPGKEAQLKMSSMRRIREMMKLPEPGTAHPGGVLILFYPDPGNEPTFVLIRRTEYDGVHSGQISLPGGRFETGDRDLSVTALRETQEEIGTDPSKIQLMGKLSDLYIPPSNFMVTPFIGSSEDRPDFRPDPSEVAGIIEVPLAELLDEKNATVREFRVNSGLTVSAPCFVLGGQLVWGATSMILNELKQMIQSAWS